jgi:hypothetical protein
MHVWACVCAAGRAQAGLWRTARESPACKQHATALRAWCTTLAAARAARPLCWRGVRLSPVTPPLTVVCAPRSAWPTCLPGCCGWPQATGVVTKAVLGMQGME